MYVYRFDLESLDDGNIMFLSICLNSKLLWHTCANEPRFIHSTTAATRSLPITNRKSVILPCYNNYNNVWMRSNCRMLNVVTSWGPEIMRTEDRGFPAPFRPAGPAPRNSKLSPIYQFYQSKQNHPQPQQTKMSTPTTFWRLAGVSYVQVRCYEVNYVLFGGVYGGVQ